MYRMLATDVDGTLVNSTNALTENTHRAVHAAEAAGVTIVVATARPYGSTTELQAHLGLKDLYVIASSGSSIWRAATNEQMLHLDLSSEQVKECARFAARHDFGCLAVRHDGSFYHAPDSKGADFYREIFKVPSMAVDFETEECTNCCKIMLFTEIDPADIARCLDRAEAELSHFSYSKTWENIVEIYPAGVSKHTAVARLAEMLSIPLSEVVAVGDDRVDMGMVQIAGLGVAMENGDADLKAAADFITRSNDEDGVAYMIHKFMLNADV